MLQEIRIRSLGVIDDAVLDLHPGLTVVTGETGAGKTMVVTGLSLLLGSRADPGLVRTGARSASVEGIVELVADHPALVRAEEAGADTSEGLILARTLSAEGRSRAHLGGRTVPASTLAEVGEHLVAVHGQADQWRLRQADQHREMLDDYGWKGISGPLTAYRQAYREHEDARRDIARLRTVAAERAQEVDLLRFGLEQIEALDPQPGEDEALRLEDSRLGHAEELRRAALTAQTAITGDDGYGDDTPSAASLLTQARGSLSGLGDADPALADLERRAAELTYLATDLGSDLAAYAAGVDLDPERLEWVQQRRADLAGLLRKYGESIDAVLDWGRRAAARVDELDTADERLSALEESLPGLHDRLVATAETLTGARRKAAARLAKAVTTELSHLAMGKAQVEVAVEPAEIGAHGADLVEIRLAANPGAPARSVAKAASGGELSRVMLALEVVTGAANRTSRHGVPTFVFDEVDAGVGGRAALDVGARLAALAEHAQVVVVTHLAQVAAFADRHLVVTKASDGQVTASGIAIVDGQEQERELARMMAGVESEVALSHARELRDQAAHLRAAQR